MNVWASGTAADKEARLAAAQTEEEWKGCGAKVGLEMWRVENKPATETSGPKFGVKRYGKPGLFYQGDSFILLNTYKKDPKSEKLDYDIHFWLGKESSQDERGVAAYKTVELDDLLGQVPVQHRETQDFESKLFLSYFPKGIIVQEGGIASGFIHVESPNYKPRLLHVKGKKNVKAVPVPLAIASLNEDDVFILDLGTKLIQFNGKTANPKEKMKAKEIANDIISDRLGRAKLTQFDSGDSGAESAEFWEKFGGKQPIAEKSPVSDADTEKVSGRFSMWNMSDSTGSMKITEVTPPTKAGLNPNDVTIVDTDTELFVWVGKGASRDERAMCMRYADKYIADHKRPESLPVTRVIDGQEPQDFLDLFNKK